MSALVYLDCETTGLDAADEIWEFAAIRRSDGAEYETHAFVDHDPDLCARLPESFRADHLARFPGAGPDGCPGTGPNSLTRADAAELLGHLFVDWPKEIGAKPLLVGAAPHYDAGMISRHLAEYRLRPGWSHRYKCVEAITAGHLRRVVGGLADCARALGIDVDPTTRHTATGDMLLCRAIWDAVMGGAA